MDRRTFLAATAAGLVGASAGCTGRAGSPDVEDGGDAAFAYPLFPPSSYDVEPERVQDPPETPTPFEALTEEARLELATAVHRGEIRTGDSPALLDGDRHQGQVAYRDEAWSVRIGVTDAFTKPEHGPEGDPNWEDPIALSTDVADGELTLSLTNTHDAELPIHYRFRPVFGVLVAVAGETAVLHHDGYADSAHVRTDGLVRGQPAYASDYDETLRLDPGEVLEETYAVPDGVTGDATVRASVWIGDETVDILDNRRGLAVATMDLEF